MRGRDALTDALDRLITPFAREGGDWDDVLERAGASGRPSRGRMRSMLVVTACVLAAVLALAPPFGLAGRVVDAFRDEGKPVPVSSLTKLDREALVFMFCNRLELAAPRGRAPERRCLDGNPRIEEIANNGSRLYWRVTFPDGRTCLASGQVRARRDTFGRGRSRIGSIGCPARLPTEERPITTDDIALSIDAPGDRARILRARGLAAPSVAEVGLVDEQGDVLKTPVEDLMYEISQPPDRPWVAIAAYDESGDELHRERLHIARRPPRIDPNVKPPQPPPPPPLPRAAPLQSAETVDARIDVYRSGFVRVRLKSTTSRAFELVRPRTGDRRVPISCFDVAYGAGAWETIGSGAYGIFGLEMRTVVSGPRGSGALTPPVDACSVRGVYGRRWNDWRGTHDAVEVAFTPLGARFFAEQAAARDLALFVRSPALRQIRDRMRQGAPAPSARAIASRYPPRVVALERRRAVLPSGKIGVWSDARDVIVATTQAENGRRLYVELRSGRVGPHNLGSIGFVF